MLSFLALCLPVAAQEPINFDQLSFYRPELLSSPDNSKLLYRLPVLAFLDGRCVPFSTELGQLGRESIDFWSGPPTESYTVAQVIVRPDRSKDISKDSPPVEVSPADDPVYYGGEVGFMYGHSSGKFGGDDYQSYLTGGVGNDKFQINVGAFHEESTFQNPRRFR